MREPADQPSAALAWTMVMLPGAGGSLMPSRGTTVMLRSASSADSRRAWWLVITTRCPDLASDWQSSNICLRRPA